jgi:hypothetical protein
VSRCHDFLVGHMDGDGVSCGMGIWEKCVGAEVVAGAARV